jgi:hypothetical protein
MKHATATVQTSLGRPLVMRWAYDESDPYLGLGVELEGPDEAVALAKTALASTDTAWAPELGHALRGPKPEAWGWASSMIGRLTLRHRAVFPGPVDYVAPEGLELPELGDDELM